MKPDMVIIDDPDDWKPKPSSLATQAWWRDSFPARLTHGGKATIIISLLSKDSSTKDKG